MSERQRKPSGGREFAAQAADVLDRWLAGRITDAEAADWAFRNAKLVERYSAGPQEAERLWRALGALTMLSTCQPGEVRSTRREVQRARRALQASLSKG